MKHSLQLKLSQHLTLTPQLQQSIRLLQLSTLELNQELEQILADNPLLERLDDPSDAFLRLAPNGTIDGHRSASGSEAESGRDAAVDGTPGAGGDADDARDTDDGGSDYDAGDERVGEWGEGSGRPGSDDREDDRTMPQLAASGRTLTDHLMAQLAATR